jgi:hypothetical protein
MERWQELDFESFAAWHKETGKQCAKASYERRKASEAAAAAAKAAEMSAAPMQVESLQPTNENAERGTKTSQRRSRWQRRLRRAALADVHPQDVDQIEVVDDWLAHGMEALGVLEALEDEAEVPEAQVPQRPSDPLDRMQRYSVLACMSS